MPQFMPTPPTPMPKLRKPSKSPKARPPSPSPPMATHVTERTAQWRTSLGQLSHEDACARAAVHLLSSMRSSMQLRSCDTQGRQPRSRSPRKGCSKPHEVNCWRSAWITWKEPKWPQQMLLDSVGVHLYFSAFQICQCIRCVSISSALMIMMTPIGQRQSC